MKDKEFLDRIEKIAKSGKKRVDGNKKGGQFERDICRGLTKFITGSEKPEIFWRSASSGAKATQDLKSGIVDKKRGDIVSVEDSKGSWLTRTYSIECKSYNSYDLTHLFTLDKGLIWKWWGQCCEDARLSGKAPLLIFKKNRSQILAMFHEVPHWEKGTSTCISYSNTASGNTMFIYQFNEIFGGLCEEL